MGIKGFYGFKDLGIGDSGFYCRALGFYASWVSGLGSEGVRFTYLYVDIAVGVVFRCIPL